MYSKILRIARHRMGTDGRGVSTLVAFHGCPLKCKYCINDFCHDEKMQTEIMTPEELLKRVEIDSIFFQMTGGGVVFGGGEPLLNSKFIELFLEIAPKEWKYRVETSLYAEWSEIVNLLPYIDQWIVDIKDVNPEIYKAYTGFENQIVMDNLIKLSEKVGRDHITIRVPLIPGYNSESDNEYSDSMLVNLGKIDRFKYQLHNEWRTL